MTISWPPYGRWAAGYGTDEKALSWVPKTQVAGKVGYAMPPGGHPQLAAGFALSVAVGLQEEGRRLPVHPVAEQPGHQPRARAAALRAARPVPRQPLHQRGVQEPLAGGAAVSGGAAGRCRQRAARPVDDPDRQVRGGAAPGRVALWAGEDPQAILDEVAAQWDAVTERIGVDKQRAAYEAWAGKPNAYPTAS